ncbi:hypothetical protein PILCRDRAFT_7351 [Piloderma croceum F 1598]|uniref:Extracellular membrane protein CFEM domain-containing protein n=1 Tax=Piloderma croceum (strain F 1598) TaxID=765440 RepID=A0A0C3FYU0_PILCF|nr:hypothetical protein PILCRDRAFT_7351 [Piloderma croceum F 1598]
MSVLRLPWGVLVFTFAALVAADSLDALNNKKGQTPCCVTQQLLVPCQSSISRDCNYVLQEADVKLGSICTCNTVVFNLWNACLETRNGPAPTFNDWSSACQAHMTSITNNDYPLHNDAKGIDIPTWAYIGLREGSFFDLGAAIEKTKGWSTFQIILPVIVGVSLLAICLAALFWYRRRTRRKYGRGNVTAGLWQSTFRGSSHQPVPKSDSRRAPSNNTGRSKPWTIDDFEPDQGGRIRLSPSPASPPTRGFRHKPKSSEGFWRNPFKARPVQVISLQPRQGFRVDDVELNTPYSEREGRENDMPDTDQESWAIVRTEEIFDAQGDGEDERSVLLISQAPGVDFSLASDSNHADGPSPTADVNIIPPSPEDSVAVESRYKGTDLSTASLGSDIISRQKSPISPTSPRSSAHSRGSSVESFIRPSLTDPVMLFPSSVRAAGYNGITNPYSPHSRRMEQALDLKYRTES